MDLVHTKVVLILLLTNVTLLSAYTTNSAGSLYTALTYGYNNLVRPSGTTDVTVKFGVLSVNFLDVKTSQFSVTGWLDVSWTDSRYSWTPSSFSGITEMYLDSTYCWNPKIIVDNALDNDASFTDDTFMFKIGDTGEVSLSLAGAFTVFCSIDVTYYPYDVQTCYISVKSWSYPAAYVSLTSGGLDSDQYAESDVWEVTLRSVTSDSVSVSSETYSNLRFTFKLKRRSSTFIMTLVMPLVLVSFLGLCVFSVPAECSSKLGFAAAILIAEVLQLGLIVQDSPMSARTIPILGMYILVLIVLSLMEIFMTIMVIKIYHNKDRSKRLPNQMEKLAAMFFFLTCYKLDDPSSMSTPSSEIESTLESPQATGSQTDLKHPIKRRLSLKTISPDCSFATSSKEDFRKGRRSRAWGDNGALCGGGSDRKYTWEEVSCALDRFCFVLFVLVRLIFAIVFLTVISIGAS